MGISITDVELNQGTRINIAQAADWVGGDGRATFAVKDRDSLIRVHFTVPEDWVPHEVEGRLHLYYPDNTEETLTQTFNVEGSSHEGTLNRTFYFGLQAALGQAHPGTQFQVELIEDQSLSSGAEGVWQTPADGPNHIGFEADPMQIKMMLVPIRYQAEGKDITAEITDDDKQRINDWMYENNPVQEVLIEVHEPITISQALGGLSPVLSVIAQLRAQEAPDDNVYYHALLDQGCQFTGCGNGGLLGQAIDIPGPLKSQSGGRIASSMYYKPNGTVTEMSLETIVHEHGHTQGQFHIFCPNGGSQGNDGSYPDPNGKIQEWGFGVRNFQLHSPTAEYDYMSYCRPQWFGPWTWTKAYERVRALTSWDFGDGGAPEETYPLLVGAYHEDGTTDWWTMDGALFTPRVSATDHFEFEINGEWVSQAVEIRELSESDAYWIFTPLPGPISSINQIRRLEGEVAAAVDVNDVRVLHRATSYASE
jgi:hypothetical protein